MVWNSSGSYSGQDIRDLILLLSTNPVSGNSRYLFFFLLKVQLVLIRNSGDDPPRDRTSQLRQLGFPTRHLGPVQMTTDTALGVTKRVVDDKSKRHVAMDLGPHPKLDAPHLHPSKNSSPGRYTLCRTFSPQFPRMPDLDHTRFFFRSFQP